MIKYDEAMKKLLERAPEIKEVERVHIDKSKGRVLAEDIFSNENVPPYHRSAMDGFALQAQDTENPPCKLKIIEDVPAGKIPAKKVEKFTATRIMTGAPLPEGANAVVMVEYCDDQGEWVIVKKKVKEKDNISPAGEDIKKNDLLAKKGTIIDFRHIGLFSACGIPFVNVVRKPKVSVITTGDEVVEIDEELKKGCIRNVNIHTLKALIESCGCEVYSTYHSGDDDRSLREVFKKAIEGDVVVFNAGISTGIYDVVRKFVENEKVEQIFYKVAIKPGKPIYFGIYKEKPIFGLPGYPASTIATFLRIVRPFLMRMMGANDILRGVWAKSKENLKLKGKRQTLVRVRLEEGENDFVFVECPPHKAGVISTIAHSSGYVIIDNPEEGIRKGERYFVNFWI